MVMEETIKISIIVPAYNVQNYIEKCLNSILNQIWRNIEVIVVNDGSTDTTPSIIDGYCSRDCRVIRIDHDGNRGLFRARLTGVQKATGKYIGFVDADDYISEDYFWSLLSRAEETKADIVVGKLVQEDENGYQWIQNIYNDYDFGIINGKDVFDSFWKQEGMLFVWHTVWNKLYSAELWRDAFAILDTQTEHIVMGEDLAISSVLFYYAKRLSNTAYGTYFYYRNNQASTALNNSFNKFKKNVDDLCMVFAFVRKFVQSVNAYNWMGIHLEKWEALYRFFWERNVLSSNLLVAEKETLLSTLNTRLCSYEVSKTPDYFYSVSTQYDRRYNDLVSLICSLKTEVVSFDIFDTAIIRPFYRPEDIFVLLEEKAKDLFPNIKLDGLGSLRISAEKEARETLLYGIEKQKEDISLDDIYECLEEKLHFSKDVIEGIKALEVDLEITCSKKRMSIYNLYRLALHMGKKVVFTSDMYLCKDAIRQILSKNGYRDYNCIFISNIDNASKRTGSLYKKVIQCAGGKCERVVHIGDNWETDVLKAREYRVKAVFYPKTTDCLMYGISDIHTTRAFSAYKGRNNSRINYEKALDYFGIRAAIATAANRIYDMPFVSYDEWSEANASPQFMGYVFLGMHLFGFAKWVSDGVEKNGYNRLAFIARDGYLPQKAYEILMKYGVGTKCEITYLYTSRKAAIPCGISSIKDIYNAFDVLVKEDTQVKDIIEKLAPFLNEEAFNTHELEKTIRGITQFNNLVKNYISKHFNENKAKLFHEQLSNYFKNEMGEKAALVDIGYSGRTNELLYNLTSKQIDGFFVHKNGDECAKREKKYGFTIHSFYDVTPSITGSQREILFSKYAPSCVGYEIKEGVIKPLLEEKIFDYAEYYVITEIQKEALRFVSDFCECFSDCFDMINVRNCDVSLPLEFYLAYLRDDDLQMFSCISFEDDMWAGGTVALDEQWKSFKTYHNLEYGFMPNINDSWRIYYEKGFDKKNIFVRALYWYLFDKKYLKDRVRRIIKE